MNRTKFIASIAVLTALILVAVPAHAGQRGGGRNGAGHGGSARGGSGRGGVVERGGPRVIVPRGVSPHFYRPYYAFRPRVSLGFGLWAGYPVGYPYYLAGYPYYSVGYPYYYGYRNAYPYGYSYPYPDPYLYRFYGYPVPSYGYPPASYGYPAQASAPGSIEAQPGPTPSGGVSLEITPTTAAVYIDEIYVGTVANFGPTSAPLSLSPGRHHIELQESGYEPLAFDTDVTPGQVIPYRGALQLRRP